MYEESLERKRKEIGDSRHSLSWLNLLFIQFINLWNSEFLTFLQPCIGSVDI